MGQDRYQLVERSQLTALLKEIDLTIALVRDNPEKVYGKLKGVRFIVLGSVNKLGSIAISARLVNVATGDIVQTAEVLARDAQGLEDALGELAKVLLMAEQEKKDYLGKRPIATLPSAKEKELTLDLGNNVSMKLLLIPAGKSMMGSPDGEKDGLTDERPQHEVTISKPFYLGVYEVTQEQYEQIMGKNPSEFKGAKYPVEAVIWEDAVEFCKKLSAKTGKTVSLPTEAQWEYACRAGTKTRFGFGDKDEDLGDYAWWGYDNGNSEKQTHPVGQKKPNAWGLYDMHGNVWEWCSDWYADSYANAKKQDPTGPDSGELRVLRGGSWFSFPQHCRSASRNSKAVGNRILSIFVGGFRVAVVLK
jgi:formylglycine-generating enzyme required for sulfatase activity